MMIHPRAIPVWGLAGLACLCLLLLKHTIIIFMQHHSSNFATSYIQPSTPASKLTPISNSTLGFQKVLAIGLPSRSDKRDALALISSLTGFGISWIDGVIGDDIPDKAVPFGIDRKVLWESNLGSWRGHMNAIRTVVEEGYASALIMEDDMDWDVRLKKQLVEFAKGASYLQYSREDASPYGDDWDVLWLGHCGEVFPETLDEYKEVSATDPGILALSRKYTISPDVTVPPPEEVHGFQNYSEFPYTRWVHISGGPICSFAYAVSQRGARKILFDLSIDHLTGPFDNALAGLCRHGRDKQRMGMQCISVTPPLFDHHKAKGTVSKDSDIQKYGAGGAVREVGWTENIVWSARGNIHKLLLGSKDMDSQFARQG
ncbi:hypothetical protein BJ878DRAFT_498189 [Calycina marina]|uniref:Glycosyltransferase family 25 protein n=1 Tax=Calycina marina TaxID=1763456 RepID=A0A9P7Z697_9HELO|nr:hypothetical protein BJ878DRAFT_498189 [Calycina marina]